MANFDFLFTKFSRNLCRQAALAATKAYFQGHSGCPLVVVSAVLLRARVPLWNYVKAEALLPLVVIIRRCHPRHSKAGNQRENQLKQRPITVGFLWVENRKKAQAAAQEIQMIFFFVWRSIFSPLKQLAKEANSSGSSSSGSSSSRSKKISF